MADELVRYGGVVIRAHVIPATTGGFVGHAEITDADTWIGSQRRSHPTWARPAPTVAEARAMLIEYGKRIVDGVSRTGELIGYED